MGDGGAAPTLASVQESVFTPRCAIDGCHGGPAPVLGLDLSVGRAHAALVGVPSAEVPAFARVQPGDAADSYLVMKLTADPRAVGDAMPPGGPGLPPAQLEAIVGWIEAGAEP